MKKLKILAACEESQTVTKAFRKKGHLAYSCDILECSGGFPEWHIRDDVLKVLKLNWDIIIAFPPCTDLSNAQAGTTMNKKILEGKPQKALEFIKQIWNSCDKVCIENPFSSFLNKNWLPYDQIIEPYFFGHNYKKKTCLWLKNLPFLISTIYCEPKYLLVNQGSKRQKLPGLYNDAKNRSKFHPFVAKAMAEQWT